MLTPVEEAVNEEYDYIIAGGGTAGLALAARLSEDPAISVLVLEAGGANINDAAILRPASYGSHFGQDAYDWGHKTVPQKHCDGMEYHWQRGKGLGGSSAINFMCWTRPPASDINDFEKLGNPGWNWDNYVKYSHRSENFVYPEEDPSSGVKAGHWKTGKEGPLLTAFPAKVIAAELDIQQTLINVGLPVAPNPLGGDPKGVYFTPNTLDPLTQTRSYSASAYYLPNAKRPNFCVAVNALVARVVTEKGTEGNLRATGVEVIVDGAPQLVKAKKEVVLSAGALKSPQILELSGIGNPEVLNKLQIPVTVDLPAVGENVQEHTFVGISWELRDDVSFDTLDLLRDPKVAAEHIELHKAGQGLFTMGVTGFAFVPLDLLSPRAKEVYKLYQAEVEERSSSCSPGLLEQYKIHLERLAKGVPACEIISFPGFMSYPNPPAPNKKYMSILVALNHNFSRGNMHSVSTSPSDDLAYDPRYYEFEGDLQTHIEAIHFVRKLAEHEPFKSMVASETNPGPAVKSDEEIASWLKKYLTTTWHTAGPASMLPREKGGVVDHNLKVYGTDNLRVVDLSIVPLHFAAHPVATVYAIAEKAADIIQGKA